MQDMEQYKQAVKSNIEYLINNNDLQNAKKIINEYEKLVPYDEDIYSIKGVIAMVEGDMEEAEKILKEGISIIKDNFDLYYNLAYLYEIQEKNIEAHRYYKKSLKYSNSQIKNQISEKVGYLEKVNEFIEHKEETEKNSIKLPAITIITFVYNAKQYIHECVQSVLNQSFKEFEWAVLDNGCTDGTSEILEEYAKKDKRIKLFKNEQNSIIFNKPINANFTKYRKNLESEYICVLDSDDFLHKDFLKNLYIVAKKYNSDISAGGTEMFSDENKNFHSRRCPPTFQTNDITKVGYRFSELYGSFRPLWGKLIRTPIYINTLEYIIKNNIRLLNGGDTFMCLNFLKNSKSIVSLNKVLHYYRIRKNSHYNSQVNKNRYLDYLIIYEKSKTLLESWNKLSDINLKFITEVLYYSMRDCIDIAVNNINAPFKDRIEVIITLLSDKKLRQILNDRGILINLIDEGINALNIVVKEKIKASN